jgi:TrmH family RNA methyltransferase
MSGRSENGRPSVERSLTYFDKLYTERETRESSGLFFVEGVRNFVQALDHGWRVDSLLYSDKLLTSALARRLVRQLKRQGVPAVRASPEQFRQVSRAHRASGVAVVLHQRIEPLHRLRPRSGTCWLVLSSLRSAGNLGTLLRSSAAVGGAGVILVGGAIDLYDPAVVRASMGAVFRQTCSRTGTRQLADWVRRHRLQMVGATPDTEVEHFDLRYRAPTLLLLGDERSGLDPQLRSICQHLVRIPMMSGTDSLNVSIAGSLLMYEVYRASRPKATGYCRAM